METRTAMRRVARLSIAGLVLGLCTQAAAATTFGAGDVLVSGQGDVVDWRRSDGSLVQILHTGVSGITAGLAFDAAHNLYVTNFFGLVVSAFDASGNLTGTFGSGYSSNIESIVFDAVGNAYVGGADGTLIYKFDAAGNPLGTFTVPTESRGTDWIDLAADQRTIFYTSEGARILRFDTVANMALSDFTVSPLPGSNAYALRILADGGVLVADTQFVLRLDPGGNVVQTYPLPGTSLLFAANLDPDGVSFWTGDLVNGQVFKVDLATGNVVTQFTTSTNSASGLAIVGEITVGRETVCDDGIDNDRDGKVDCADEDCALDPVCQVSCGNGVVEPGEQCDDGNTTSGDGCSATCVGEFCGDGIVQPGLGEVCDDGNTDNGDGCTTACQINFAPDCTRAVPDPKRLRALNGIFVKVFVRGVVDPDGDPVTIMVTDVKQDEPPSGPGAGRCPDAQGFGTSSVMLRAERLGTSDGRVYHVGFTASDGKGGMCRGVATVCVPLEELFPTCGDQGPLYDSRGPCM